MEALHGEMKHGAEVIRVHVMNEAMDRDEIESQLKNTFYTT